MKKKFIIPIISIIAICLTLTGLSYAYWYIRKLQDTTSNLTTGCFQVELTNQSGEISLSNAYPITDEEGLKLKPFSFTIHNTCSIFAHYYVNLELLAGTTLNSKFVATRVNNEEIKTLDTFKTASNSIKDSVGSYTVAEGYLGADDSEDYSVSIWIDEDVTLEDDILGKILKSKIVVNSEPGNYDPISAGYTRLGDAILANEYQTTPEIAKNKIASKQEVDLSNTAPIIKWVEKTGENSIRQVIKPTSDAISSVPELSNLSQDEQYMYICTTKNFNSDTSRYSLSNCSLKDPITLDYSGDTKYYYSDEYMAYNQASQKLYVSRNTGDITVYQIMGVTKSISTQTTNGIQYATNVYNLSCVTLIEMELEADKSDKGLYQETDDYGTTYYYRGNVKNNNVYFAGFYWQIVRINGDGSIRLIYNGTEKNATGVKQSINNKTYQFNSKYNDPAYVGYMYGNPDGTTFDEVHTNTTSSTIKTVVDDWYKTNIEDKGYSNYISTEIGFCGDRSLYSNSGGNGVQTDKDTRFGAYGRYASNTAQFTCPEPSRDLYTVSSSSIGNKALTYPVGLITYDEMVFAGMNNRHINKLSWIYSSTHIWTMSPSSFYAIGGNAEEWYEVSAGFLNIGFNATTSLGARPVINLKSEVEITSGAGITNDPYIIKTE